VKLRIPFNRLKKIRRPILAAGFLFMGAILYVLLPLPAGLLNPPLAKSAFSRNGDLLDVRIANDGQWRFSTPEVLPEKYIVSVIQFEDRYFYEHVGFNPMAIFRALKDNYQTGHVVSGASTITMQLSRMALKHHNRSYWNKFKEICLAIKLELRLSKRDILKLYATHAPMGRNIVGLQAASWHYFGRAPDELSWAEAALLAVLPNRPSMLYLEKNRKALQERRDQLLTILFREKKLNERDYQLARLEPLPTAQSEWPSQIPHLLDRLLRENPGVSEFHTTIDPLLQGSLNHILENHSRTLGEEGVRNLALVVIDHKTLQTVGYIGNFTIDKLSEYVDIASQPRSTASVIKPLLYGLMLDSSELIPTALIPDVPTTIGTFSPENHDHKFHGAVPAAQMLSQSLNVPAVRLLRRYGIDRFRQQLQRYGLTTINRSAENYGLSLILGGGEANLWELTSVYARMANVVKENSYDGTTNAVQFLKAAPDNKAPKIKFPLTPGAAWLTLKAMVEVTRPGADSNWRNYENSQVIAWKTGTSFGLRDAWAIGSNGRYTVGVWAGNADGSSAASLGGAHSAGPVLMDVFSLLGSNAWLSEPEGALTTVSVCQDDGFIASDDCIPVNTRVPAHSHYAQTTPYHQRIFLTENGSYRVHSGCESVSNMKAADWFVLPPTQEYYWKRDHSDYRTLPPWRKDCIASLQQYTAELPFDLIYPNTENIIYLPLDLDGKLSRAIFKAVHRDTDAILYWHLDGVFLGETKTFHEIMVLAKPGKHTLVLVDKNGQRLERIFTIIGGEKKSNS
jgi:penicillin-binding protein 1C